MRVKTYTKRGKFTALYTASTACIREYASERKSLHDVMFKIELKFFKKEIIFSFLFLFLSSEDVKPSGFLFSPVVLSRAADHVVYIYMERNNIKKNAAAVPHGRLGCFVVFLVHIYIRIHSRQRGGGRRRGYFFILFFVSSSP